jgi:hypothetical protein
MDDNESVRALTLKDGVNYADATMNHQFAPGYSAKDDLNNDGIIDNLE